MTFVFFSSRRRHTRCLSDWSSDVCSSDLNARHVPDWVAWPTSKAHAAGCLPRSDSFRPDPDLPPGAGATPEEIGRASCRERGWLHVVEARGHRKKAVRTSRMRNHREDVKR